MLTAPCYEFDVYSPPGLDIPQKNVWFAYESLGCWLRPLLRDLRSGKKIDVQQFYSLGHEVTLKFRYQFVCN